MFNTPHKIHVRALTTAAFLAALSVVLTRFLSTITIGGSSLRVGFGTVPLILAGLLLGPQMAALTGFVADLVGICINPMGVPHLGFTLSSVLTALLPALIMRLRRDRFNLLTVILAWLSVFVVCSMLLQPLWLSQLRGVSYISIFVARLALLPFTQLAVLIALLALYPVTARLRKMGIRATTDRHGQKSGT